MIQLNNIQIKFNDTIIERGSISLYEHQITLLTGVSGCGKSSRISTIISLLDSSKLAVGSSNNNSFGSFTNAKVPFMR